MKEYGIINAYCLDLDGSPAKLTSARNSKCHGLERVEWRVEGRAGYIAVAGRIHCDRGASDGYIPGTWGGIIKKRCEDHVGPVRTHFYDGGVVLAGRCLRTGYPGSGSGLEIFRISLASQIG